MGERAGNTCGNLSVKGVLKMKTLLSKRSLAVLFAVTMIVHLGVSVITYDHYNDLFFAEKDVLTVCTEILLK